MVSALSILGPLRADAPVIGADIASWILVAAAADAPDFGSHLGAGPLPIAPGTRDDEARAKAHLDSGAAGWQANAGSAAVSP